MGRQRKYRWPESLYARVDKSAGPDACWPWLGATVSKGYGSVGVPNGDGTFRTVGAHRAMYEMEVGPIPDGLQIDHLCRNVICVNPAHLEPVTQAENMRRRRYAEVRKCWKGHDLSGPDALMSAGEGKSRCRQCRDQYRAKWLSDNPGRMAQYNREYRLRKKAG